MLLVDTHWRLFSIAYFWHSWMFRIVIENVWGGASGPPPTLLMDSSFLFLVTGLELFCEMGEEYVKVRIHGIASVPLLACLSVVFFYWKDVFIDVWDCFSEKPVCDSSQCTKRKWLPPTFAHVCFLPVCPWFLQSHILHWWHLVAWHCPKDMALRTIRPWQLNNILVMCPACIYSDLYAA